MAATYVQQFQCDLQKDHRIACATLRNRDHIAPAARQTFPIHLQRHAAFRASAISQTRILCDASPKKRTSKQRKRSPRARHPSKTESWRSGNEAFVRDVPKTASWRCRKENFMRDVPPKLKVEVVKTKRSCEMYFKDWIRIFRARLPSKGDS